MCHSQDEQRASHVLLNVCVKIRIDSPDNKVLAKNQKDNDGSLHYWTSTKMVLDRIKNTPMFNPEEATYSVSGTKRVKTAWHNPWLK